MYRTDFFRETVCGGRGATLRFVRRAEFILQGASLTAGTGIARLAGGGEKRIDFPSHIGYDAYSDQYNSDFLQHAVGFSETIR